MLRSAIIALALTPLAPAAAWACSPAWGIKASMPSTATVAVPTNGALFVDGVVVSGVQATITSSPSTTTVDGTQLNTSWPQLPRHVHRVPLDQRAAGELLGVTVTHGFGGMEWTTQVRMGTAADRVAPTAPSAPRFSVQRRGPDTCYPGGGFEIRAFFDDATDDIGVAAYLLERTDLALPGPVGGRLPSSLQPLQVVLPSSETRACFGVVALDLASNEARGPEACIDLPGQTTDAGLPDTGVPDAVAIDATVMMDAGVPADSGRQPPLMIVEESGCSTVPPSASWPVILLALVGFRRLIRRR